MSRLLKCLTCTTSNYSGVLNCRRFSITGHRHSLMDKFYSIRIPWDYLQVRRKLSEALANRFRFERVAALGPDFACLEWLMKCGATCVEMSDGTLIKSQKQMREFIISHGININEKKLKPLAEVEPLNQKQLELVIRSDASYLKRWSHVPPIYIKNVDANDSIIADPGFQYFIECRQLEKLILGFCDFFGDSGIEHLCTGRAIVTLKELEIIFNPNLSDAAFYSIAKLESLGRAHFYFNPYVYNELGAKQRLRIARPKCYITYPKVEYIGTGR